MTLSAAEDYLKAVIENTLGSHVTVLVGPHDFDGSFQKTLLNSLPAVVIVWDGGEAAEGTSLTLDATWTLYVVTGWRGEDYVKRRRDALYGGYLIFNHVASRVHNMSMGEARQYAADGSRIANTDPIDGFGLIRVQSVMNESSGAEERMGLSIYTIELSQQMPLVGPEVDGFDDYLRTWASWDIPGGEEFEYGVDTIGVDGDLTSRFDQPQD